jgi:hypothetical protein
MKNIFKNRYYLYSYPRRDSWGGWHETEEMGVACGSHLKHSIGKHHLIREYNLNELPETALLSYMEFSRTPKDKIIEMFNAKQIFCVILKRAGE